MADTVFCTTVSGRPPQVPGVEQMVGLFINNLPVRLRFSPSSPLLALAQEMQRQIAALQSQAQLSLREVAEAAGVADRASSLFDTLLVVENMPAGSDAWAGAGGLRVESVHNALKSAYSLTGVVVPGERIGLSLVLPDLDGTATARGEAMIEEFATVFAALPGLIDGTVAAVPLPAAAPCRLRKKARTSTTRRRRRGATRTALRRHRGSVLDVLAALLGPVSPAPRTCWRPVSPRWPRHSGGPAVGTARPPRAGHGADRTSQRRRAGAGALPERGRGDGVGCGGAAYRRGGPAFHLCPPHRRRCQRLPRSGPAFPADIPFWALQAPGLEKGQEPPTSVAALAAANLDALARRASAPRASSVATHSAASSPMRWPASFTRAARRPNGSSSSTRRPRSAAARCCRRIPNGRRHNGCCEWRRSAPATMRPRSPSAWRNCWRRPTSGFALACARMRQAGLIAPEADSAWLRRAYRASRALYDAFLAYAPPANAPRDLKLGLVRAAHPAGGDLSEADRAVLAAPDMGWSRLNDRVLGVHEVPGDHVSMLSGAAAVQTAGAIASFLDMSFLCAGRITPWGKARFAAQRDIDRRKTPRTGRRPERAGG